jgi:hypothetical protein
MLAGRPVVGLLVFQKSWSADVPKKLVCRCSKKKTGLLTVQKQLSAAGPQISWLDPAGLPGLRRHFFALVCSRRFPLMVFNRWMRRLSGDPYVPAGWLSDARMTSNLRFFFLPRLLPRILCPCLLLPGLFRPLLYWLVDDRSEASAISWRAWRTPPPNMADDAQA